MQKKASGDLDGDGSPETVAVVRCDAGIGTPPNGVYVLTQGGSGARKPRVVATLVDPKDRLDVTDFAVRDGAVAGDPARLLLCRRAELLPGREGAGQVAVEERHVHPLDTLRGAERMRSM